MIQIEHVFFYAQFPVKKMETRLDFLGTYFFSKGSYAVELYGICTSHVKKQYIVGKSHALRGVREYSRVTRIKPRCFSTRTKKRLKKAFHHSAREQQNNVYSGELPSPCMYVYTYEVVYTEYARRLKTI